MPPNTNENAHATSLRVCTAAASVVVGVILVFASACGGATTSIAPQPDGSVFDASQPDAAVADAGGLVTSCPSTPPTFQSACANAGLECEYGTDIYALCNTRATCANGAWQIAGPNMSGCPTPPPTGTCPATYASVPQNAACSPNRQSCSYREGECTCEAYCGPQAPVGRTCDAGTPMTWQCTGTSPGCPSARPLIGSACPQETLSCQYGACNVPGVRCEQGTWHMGRGGCPVSTRRAKENIHYLTPDEQRTVADDAAKIRLATYRYKTGDGESHLGFIIEDNKGSPAVLPSGDRVDLYGYASMAIASLQVERAKVDNLARDVETLRAELERMRQSPAPSRTK